MQCAKRRQLAGQFARQSSLTTTLLRNVTNAAEGFMVLSVNGRYCAEN